MNVDINSRVHYGRQVDLSIAETLAALEGAAHRVSTRTEMWCGRVMNWPVLEILYEGRWIKVGRTDLFDNVSTGTPLPAPPGFKRDPIAYYCKKIWFGARIHGDNFSVVDSISDG